MQRRRGAHAYSQRPTSSALGRESHIHDGRSPVAGSADRGIAPVAARFARLGWSLVLADLGPVRSLCLSRWPPKAIEVASLALGGAASAGFAHEDTWLSLDHRCGRAVVDQAFRRHRRTNSLFDDDGHLEDARALDECVDAIADLHARRRLGRATVHTNVAATAGGRRRRTGLIDPDGPQPYIYPRTFDEVIVPAMTDRCSRSALL